MRYPAHHKSETRDRIIAAASRRFRDRGLDRVGVADLMATAGLTHGGFYAHFAGKEAVVAAVCAHTLDHACAAFERMAQGDADRALDALVRTYLAPRHRTERADGCLLVALGPELIRGTPAVRRTVAVRIDRLLTDLSAHLPGRNAAARRDRAGLFFAQLIGTLLLSRLLRERDGERAMAYGQRALRRAVRSAATTKPRRQRPPAASSPRRARRPAVAS